MQTRKFCKILTVSTSNSSEDEVSDILNCKIKHFEMQLQYGSGGYFKEEKAGGSSLPKGNNTDFQITVLCF